MVARSAACSFVNCSSNLPVLKLPRFRGHRNVCVLGLEAILKGEVSNMGVWETDEEYFDEDNVSIEAHHIVAVQSAIANNTEDIY